MEHSVELEIVAALLVGESHARELAKNIGSNHMTVSRKLRKLMEENVVDYRLEGKNKTYRLKKTPEALNYAMTAEHYKLNRKLRSMRELRQITEAIRGNPNIRIAMLFGSHAKDTATRESDIDLYVDAKDTRTKKKIEALNTRLSVKTGEWDPKNTLMKEIQKNHIILKGAEEYYEKTGLFG